MVETENDALDDKEESENAEEIEDEETEGDVSDDADAEDTSGLDLEEVRIRFEALEKQFNIAKQAVESHGRGSKQADAAYKELATCFMLFKLNSRVADTIMDMMRGSL